MNNVPTTMKNTLLILALFAFGTFLQSCGSDDDEGTKPARTVDRSQLTDKDWYRDGGLAFRFDSDGIYNLNGIWRWNNNSDTMTIINSRQVETTLIFEYIEANEMKCGGLVESTRVV